MIRQVVRCEALPTGFALLQEKAAAEGFEFLDRLSSRWQSGRYLEDADASLFAVYDAAEPVAIGAQTSDEYAPAENVRRMRHVYVHPSYRRAGVGRTLAGALIQEGFARAPLLSLNATHAVSRAFWESLGFSPVSHPTRSHELSRDA